MNINFPKIDECRPEVLQFARLMEYKLRLNDHKGGWKNCNPSFLYGKLKNEEVPELHKEVFGESCGCREACCPHVHWPSPHRIALEAADVANMAMMVADVYGGLDF